ncbi:hypothetical protein TrCOL_g2191 [Triparma columacea]|uniref:Uncharacterized protein n=1 Tax=Triparma columacea TaxID=722753 RepID=A0A9W7L3F4_9STRA|nr:hypothetical protein TrCOL_g2191 [Triparma columacea]
MFRRTFSILNKPPPITYSLSSWFRIPSEMSSYEVLSRSSCFPITLPPSSPSTPSSTVLITTQHVVAPQNYPQYYPDAWISHVQPRHIRCYAEVRNECGDILHKCELQDPLHHPTLDLTVLSIGEGGLGKWGGVYDLCEGLRGMSVTCHGHTLVDDDGSDVDVVVGDDSRVPLPLSVPGRLLVSTAKQNFASTDAVLTVGMCGGPIVSDITGGVVGMVEGVVPEGASPGDELIGAAAYVGVEGIREGIDMWRKSSISLASHYHQAIGSHVLDLILIHDLNEYILTSKPT